MDNNIFDASAIPVVRLSDQSGVDPAWLSARIGEIYDCVLAPHLWTQVLESICGELSFGSAALAIRQSRPKSHHILAHYGFDKAWLDADNAYIPEMTELWGGAAHLEGFPLEEPMLSAETAPPERLQNNRYYQEVLRPRGLSEAILIHLAREVHSTAYVAFNRYASSGPIRKVDVAALRLLAPHLRRAAVIADLLELRGLERTTFRSALDALGSSVILVDEDLRVIHTNRAADDMLARGTLLDVVQDRLTVEGEVAQKGLRSAVRLAANNESAIGRRGFGVPISDGHGAVAILHVLPLGVGKIRAGLVQRAVAAVFVAVAGEDGQTPVDAISLLYELSPAEGRIFSGISQGSSIAEIAQKLGIATSTARTHLLRVFEKTGCKRQPELVALAAQLSLRA